MDHLIQKKVCMVGDFSVGKTCLVRRFVYDLFEENYITTIGVNITRKEVYYENSLMRLLIWDLAGGERYRGARSSYLQGAAGVLVVCDLTRPETIDNVNRYNTEFLEINPNSTVVVVGNKLDLPVDNETSTLQKIEKISTDIKAPFQLASAKTGEGVESAFKMLVRGISKSIDG